MSRLPIAITVAFSLGLTTATAVAGVSKRQDKKAIAAVIESAYVQGVHVERSASLMREGFNPGFVMFRNAAEGVKHVSLDDWASRMKPAPADAPKPNVKSEIRVLDVEGGAAVARIKIWRDGKLVFTDYMSLYKSDGKWSIVGKIYHSHQKK